MGIRLYTPEELEEIGAEVSISKVDSLVPPESPILSLSPEERESRWNEDPIRVLIELAQISFSDIRECFDSSGRLLDIRSLPNSIAPAISGIDIKRRVIRSAERDEEVIEEYTTKIRLWDKTKTLSMLGKYFGLLKDRVEHTGENGGPINIQTTTIDVERLSPEGREILLREIKAIGVGSTEGVRMEDAEISTNEKSK